MKANRSKLTALIALALLAVGVGLGAAAQRFQPTNKSRPDGSPTAHRGTDLGLDVDLLIQNVIGRWRQQEALSADVQWQVHLFEQTLSGSGEYTQTGRGAGQRHGLALRADDPQFPMSLQQAVLASQPILWTQWRSTLDESASMVRLADVAAANGTSDMPTAGLALLIWQLHQAYDFHSARHVVYGGRQLLLVQGGAKGEPAADMAVLPFLGTRANGVSLLLDASTGFPHRIQWEAIREAGRQPLVTVDLFHVRYEVSANEELLQPKAVVPDATDETEQYRMAISPKTGQQATSRF